MVKIIVVIEFLVINSQNWYLLQAISFQYDIT